MPRPALLRAALLACVALLSLPAAGMANGLNICVNKTAGDCSFTVSTLQEALDIANNDAPRDTVTMGEGTFTPGNGANDFDLSSVIDLKGSGRDKTFVEAPNATQFVIWMNGDGSTAQDFTIRMPSQGIYGIALDSGTMERVDVIAFDTRPKNNGKAIGLRNGANTVRDSRVIMPLGANYNDWALHIWSLVGNAVQTIENVELTGDNAVVQDAGVATTTKAKLTGHRTYVVNGRGTATLNNVLVKTTAGSTATPFGLQNQANNTNITTLTANHVTVVGPGAGQGVVVGYSRFDGGACDGTAGSSTTKLNNTTISGFPVDSIQDSNCNPATNFQTTCPAPAAMTANLQWTFAHSETGNYTIQDGCFGQDNRTTGNPGLVSASDPRPRQPSPLIDKGTTTPDSGGETDLAGSPRVFDGDGSAGPRRDIGAYEYLRQAPTVSASVNPPTGPPGSTFTFTANGTDADGESLTYIWTFDDGSFSLMPNATKSFPSLGAHVAEVQAIDPSSQSAKATATATVANAPVATATPTPTVTPPKDVTGPNVTVKGGTLRADKKRKVKVTISCPATETAPCKIVLSASSSKKIKFGKAKAKVQSLGKGSGSVPAGKSATVTLTLTKKAYSYIKKKKKLAARLAVTASDAAGNSTKSSAKATLRPPK